MVFISVQFSKQRFISSEFFKQGGWLSLQVPAQRRGLQLTLISVGTLTDVPAIFLFSLNGKRLNPRTSMSNFSAFLHFMSCTIAAICNFSRYLDFTFSQNWGSLVQSGSWNVIYLCESWYLILTGDKSFCRMSTVHQLLLLFFHWTLNGLGFCFRVVVTTDAFHNTIRKVVSVQVCYSCRVDKMTWAPWGNPVGKNWHSNRLWIYTFIAGNSSK